MSTPCSAARSQQIAVFMAGMLALGITIDTLSVLTLANNVHVQKSNRGEADRRVFAGLLAEAGQQFIEDDGEVKITTFAVRRVKLLTLSKQVSCYIREGADDLNGKRVIGPRGAACVLRPERLG